MNDFSKRDNRNACTKDWSKWWRDFLETSPDRDRVAIEILGQRYVEEMPMDLAEKNRCADRLPEQIWRIESDHPDINTSAFAETTLSQHTIQSPFLIES